ncbi:sugar ABC transporter substrate-binding protein [Paenarthrobacter nicotinovorans]|uniref:sugar ABC transporter substrate-binding protein n=1 Tax=Paenarthrobacter nicotinovorans TaxID=29320 RepID=UPI003821C23B
MKKRKALIAGIAAVGVSLSLAACSGSSQSASSGPQKVGLAAMFLDDPFQVAMNNAVMDTSKKAGFEALPLTNANFDLAKQLTDIRTLLDQGINGLFVVPVDTAGMQPALDQAAERKVPIISVGNALPGAYVSVDTDNYGMAEANCKYLGDATGGQGTILMTIGPQEVRALNERRTGFMDCMKKNYPKITVKEFMVGPDSQKCYDAIRTGFSSESNVVGIYVHSDAVCGTAVPNALQSIGKLAPAGDPKHIFFSGIDGSALGHEAIRQGNMDFLTSQPAAGYGSTSANWMVKALAGDEVKTGPTDHNSEVREVAGAKVDVLPFIEVTKKNVDDSSLWGNAR